MTAPEDATAAISGARILVTGVTSEVAKPVALSLARRQRGLRRGAVPRPGRA